MINCKKLRLSIWQFNNDENKVSDEFIPITNDLRNMSLIQFHKMLNDQYFNSDKQLILFQGREIEIDKRSVGEVFDVESVTIKVQGVNYQINPMKLPLNICEESQVANMSESGRQFYQKRKNEVYQKRAEEFKQNLVRKNLIKHRPKLCYVIDTTKSMYQYRQQIMEIVTQARLNLDNADFSLLLYKDVGQKQNGKYVGINFPNRPNHIQDLITSINYEGGDDEPDDLNGALEQALSYNWIKEKQEKYLNQQIVVITDSPCHGKQYHNLVDDYPDKDLAQVIEQMKELKISLTIYTFNQTTNLMIEQIRKHFSMHGDLFRHIEVDKMYEQREDENQISQSQSIQRPVSSFLQNPIILNQLYEKLVRDNVQAKINSIHMDLKMGTKMNYHLSCNTVEEVLKAYHQGQPIINVNADHQIQVRISFVFINNGDDKIFLLQLNDQEFTNKIFFTKTKQLRLNLKEAINVITTHQIAKELLSEFKKRQEKTTFAQKYPIPNVEFSDLILIKLDSAEEYIVCEEFHPFPYVEFNTQINDQINIRTQDQSHINQFLQHFTHESLGLTEDHKTMVINLVGFSSDQKTVLTDPHLLTYNLDQDTINQHDEQFGELNLDRFYSIYE